MEVALPTASDSGAVSVEQAIAQRRSRRSFSDDPLTLQQLSQLLWAAQGITSPDGLRAAPSAGALYPLEVYVAAGRVERLAVGVYRYVPQKHALAQVSDKDVRADLARCAHNQRMISRGPAVLVIAADFARTARKYGERAERYVWMEAGAAVENVYLQCEALGLGTCIVGAFDDELLKEVIGVHETPLAMMTTGNRAR